MAINHGNFAKALYPGVSKWYGKSYDEWATEYTDLFDMNSSSRAYEEDVSVSSFGLAPTKNQGDGVQYDSEEQGFITRYTHAVQALGFIVTREMYEDDLYDVVSQRRSESLAMSMNQTKETIAANVYNRATSGSYLGTGGVSLLSTAHPNIAGGTYANKPSTDVDISEAALEQACIDISKLKNDRGLKIALKSQSLIIPVDSMFEVERILKSTLRPTTADNDINALNSMGKFNNVIVNHYLTDTDAWFIRTSAPNGMKGFDRRAMEFTIDNDFDTENAKFKATARYSFGWSDPRAIYGSTGA